MQRRRWPRALQLTEFAGCQYRSHDPDHALALLLAHGGNLQQGKYNAKFYVTVGPQSSAKYTMYGIAREPSGFVALIGP